MSSSSSSSSGSSFFVASSTPGGTPATGVLAARDLPATRQHLFVATEDTIIKSIVLVNSGALVAHVNVYLDLGGGLRRRVIPKDLALSAGYLLETDVPYPLTNGQGIEGDADQPGVEFAAYAD